MLVMGMSSKKHQIPAIRFKGFTDAWEQRKLGDIADIKDSARISNELWVENGIPYLRSSDLVNGELNGELFISKETYEGYASKTGAPQKDDVLFTSGGKVGVVYHKKDESPVYVQGGAVLYVKTSTSNLLDGSFLSIYFGSPRMQTYMDIASSGGTIKHFTLKPANASPIIFPGLSEQQKIGAFFKELDKTIALHQRMSDKQKKLKANLLQMMFPRNGEKIPEVRLAGFAEDWSQRTLEDISDKVTEKNKAREFTETLTNSAEYGIISQSDYFDKDISNINNIDGYYVVRPDDFVYNPRISNFAPVGPIKRNNLNRIGIMSPLYYVFRPKRVDHTFLEKYFETSYWHIFMKMNGDSGARADRFAIKDTILKEMPIPYPIMEEQVKIGIFFNQLDKSIVLHQEKIAHLKILKSTLLNKMFI